MIRELVRGLAEASDGHVARAIALVDGLPERGDVDQLIAPLRPRLAQLRPSRPLRFSRLLFMPLEPLIVPAPRWRPNAPAVPRSVLQAFAATVRAGMPAQSAKVDGLIRGAALPDTAAVARAGAALWPHAAAVLSAAPPPVGWAETGLNAEVYPSLAQRVGAVLRHALDLEELVAESVVGIAPPRPALIRAMLEDTSKCCPGACPMLITVLLGRLPQCAGLLASLATEMGPSIEVMVRQASQEAADALLLRLEAEGGSEQVANGHDMGDAAQETRRIGLLLRQLAGCTHVPQLHARLQAVRQRLNAGCHRRFVQAMTKEFLPALLQGGGAGALEATARHLRELAIEARVLGAGDVYEAQLRQAVAAVVADRTRSAVVRARLVEILAGSEAALAVLKQRA